MKSLSALTAFSLSVLSVIPAVSAHGYLANFAVDGTNYEGTNPNSRTPKESVIRAISDPSPRTDLSSDDMGCGADTADLQASLSAPAKPGSKLTFDWKAADRSDWPHDTGPMETYIASCNGDCKSFDSKQAKWIKISDVGHEDGGSSTTWVQKSLMDGATTSVNLPDDTPNGEYLVRHEIIALHRATAGVPEFYPACAQITVSGGQDGELDETDAVSFPGTYSLDDPGLSDSPYGKTDGSYKFPGPSVQTKIASGDSSSGGNDSSASVAPSSTVSGATATTTTSSGPKATGSEGAADSGPDGNQGSSDDSDDDGETDDDSDCSESDYATSAAPTSTATLDISDNSGVVTVTQVVTVFVNAAVPTSSMSKSTMTVVETVTVTDTSSVAAQTTAAASAAADSGDYAYKHRRSRLFYRMDLQKA